jgi:ABC-type transport system involved in multi-copper enzyme maturation permease subunit
MSDQLRSELLKLRTTRMGAILLLVAGALTLLGAFAEGFSAPLDELAQEHEQRMLIGGAATNAVLLATFVGLLAVTNEFRYGTIHATLLFEPRRRVVLAAKLGAAALAGIVFAVVCVVLAFGAGLAIITGRDVDVALTGTNTVVLVVGPIAASALSAMLGVTVGALIRNQVGAITALAVYALAVDALLFAAVPSMGRYLPGQAGNALSGLPDEDLLAPGLGAAVVVAWALAFIAAAIARTERSDI